MDNSIDKISFIAPLDNLIWDRKMIEALFDFEYTWEVYVPKSKRKYGYYVLPILFKDQFIGRIEFDHFSKNGLKVINKWFEDGVDESFIQPYLEEAMKHFERYIGGKK